MIKPYKLKCSIEEHHASAAVGSTMIKVMIERTPAHYLHAIENPRKDTAALKFGRDLHQAILEPKHFKENLIVPPVFAGVGSKLAREQWYLKNHGKTIVDAEDLEVIEKILKNISKHKQASKLLTDGNAEESIFWEDAETGILCKIRPDFIRDGHIVIDPKSTQDASEVEFKKDIGNRLYHVSAAMYLDGCTAFFGTEFDKFIFIACEKEGICAVDTFNLNQESIEEGRFLYKNALKKLKACRESGHYQAYDDSKINPIGLNSYHYRSEKL